MSQSYVRYYTKEVLKQAPYNQTSPHKILLKKLQGDPWNNKMYMEQNMWIAVFDGFFLSQK